MKGSFVMGTSAWVRILARSVVIVAIGFVVGGGCWQSPSYCDCVRRPVDADVWREWVASPVPCVLEGAAIEVTDERVLSAFAGRFPLCTDQRWRRVMAMPVSGGTDPVIKDFVFPDERYAAMWHEATTQLSNDAPGRECVMMLNLRERGGNFLASVGGHTYRGCVQRYVVGSEALFLVRVRATKGPRRGP